MVRRSVCIQILTRNLRSRNPERGTLNYWLSPYRAITLSPWRATQSPRQRAKTFSPWAARNPVFSQARRARGTGERRCCSGGSPDPSASAPVPSPRDQSECQLAQSLVCISAADVAVGSEDARGIAALQHRLQDLRA